MNWPRYKFSKESEPELLEFFKAVAEQDPSNLPPPNVKALWQKILPFVRYFQPYLFELETFLLFKDESFQRFQQNSNPVHIPLETEVIDITESDDEKIESPISVSENELTDVNPKADFLLPDASYSNLIENESNIKSTEDLINEVRDHLETESFLSEDFIKQFGSEHRQEQLENIFKVLVNDLNSECILKLWKSITAADCVERNIVAISFVQNILVQKILCKCDSAVTALLQETFNAFPEEVPSVLLKIILETSNISELKKLRDNLNALSDDHKNILLREFEGNCQKLELSHLGTVLCLLTTHTKVENFKKLVELMSNVCKDFAIEKSFGKLLLEVVQVLGSNVIHCENQLKYIITTHKSVFKTQIVNIFERFLQDQRLLSQSQSIRM